MFNFKSRNELKERIAFLEKQLEVSERDVEVEKKKWIEEQQYTSLLSNKNEELIKELETMKKEYEETKDAMFENFSTGQEYSAKAIELEKELKEKDGKVAELRKTIVETEHMLFGKALPEISELGNKVKDLEETLERRDGVIKILEKDVEILEEKLGKQMEVYYKAKGTIGLREYEAEKAYRKIEQLRKERRRSQENYGKYIKKLKKDKVKLKLKLKEKEETIYNFCLMENKVSDRLGFELRKANEENGMLRNENKENKKLIKELEIKNNKGAEWLLSKEEERKLREELSNLRSQLEEKEEEVTRLAIDSDKAKVKQKKELTKVAEEKIQLAIEKQEALDEMEKLLQDNKRKRNYANGLGKINKVVKIVRHKK